MDPRLHRHSQPPSPAADTRDEAARRMGFDSYVIDNIVKRMSTDDWMEFLTRRKYDRALIHELQVYLNEKYCNEERTDKQDYYGQLCNTAMYPAYYPPYEVDMSAKNYHKREDGEIPSSPCNKRIPDTFYQREFGASVFSVYMTDEEYDYRFFTPHEMAVEDHTHPRGFYTYTKYPRYPANRVLCRRTIDGKVEHVRSMPMMSPMTSYEVDE